MAALSISALRSPRSILVDTITVSLSKNIRVNAINPGMIETEGIHSAGFLGSDFEKGIVAQTPLGRIGQPGDMSPAAVYLVVLPHQTRSMSPAKRSTSPAAFAKSSKS
jgi:NAD(P)-dependent dehydrogenase (short-subunit alcohol dehydrogenase family)